MKVLIVTRDKSGDVLKNLHRNVMAVF